MRPAQGLQVEGMSIDAELLAIQQCSCRSSRQQKRGQELDDVWPMHLVEESQGRDGQSAANVVTRRGREVQESKLVNRV